MEIFEVSFKKNVVTVAIAQLAAAQVGTALAQTEPKPGQTLEKVEIVGTTQAVNYKDAPVGRVVVTAQELSKYGEAKLTESLARVQGVTVRRVGSTTKVMLNGLGSGYTAVMIDGEPAPEGFDLDSISMEMVERVELSRIGTADQSQSGIAGTINFVMKKRVKTAETGIKASTWATDANRSASVSGKKGWEVGNVKVGVTAILGHEGNTYPISTSTTFVDGTGAVTGRQKFGQMEKDWQDWVEIAPTLTWSPTESDKVTLDGLTQVRRFRFKGTWAAETLFGEPPEFSRDDMTKTTTLSSVRLGGGWVHRWANGDSLEAGLKLTGTQRRQHADISFFGQTNARDLERDISSRANERAVSGSTKYKMWYAEQHALSMGVDGARTSKDDSRIQRDTSTTGHALENLDEAFTASISRGAAFAQDEWEISPTAAVYMGARWEAIKVKAYNNTGEGANNRYQVASPTVQLLIKPEKDGGSSSRFSLGRAYKMPSVVDVLPRRWVVPNNTAATPNFEGNPGLRPELSWVVDASHEREVARGMTVQGSVGFRQIKDVVLYVNSLKNGAWVQRPENSGKADVKNVEVEGRLDLSKLMREGPAIDVRVSGARYWSRVRAVSGPDNRLAEQVPYSASIGGDWKPQGTQASLGATLTAQGATRTRISSYQVEASGRTRKLDAYVTWQPTQSTKATVSASTSLGHDKEEAVDYLDASGGQSLRKSTESFNTVRLVLEFKL